jgi:hypothetical protein
MDFGLFPAVRTIQVMTKTPFGNAVLPEASAGPGMS